MKDLLKASEFENSMSKTQTILGWCYLPLHFLVFPLLFSLYAAYSLEPLSENIANIIYYALGLAFVLIVMFRYLRRSFDTLLDRPGACFITFLMALGVDYVLSYLISIVLLMLGETLNNPNNEAITQLAATDSGMIKGIAIFIAPVVEETLFRGVAFGSLRKKSRVAAYAVSVVLFCVYHVWQYAFLYADPKLLLYALQYVPISLVLAWSYERSSCIWVPMGFHMMLNAMSFYVIDLLS